MTARDRLAAHSLTVALVALLLSVGGALPVVMATASLGFAAVGLVYVKSSRQLVPLPSVIAFMIAIAAVTAVQIIPLPMDLLSALAPQKAQILSANARALGDQSPSWACMSLSPHATELQLVKFIGLVALAIVATRIAASRSGRRQLVTIAASAALIVAVIALVHTAIGATSVFGLYTPVKSERAIYGPIINNNHLATLSLMGLPLSVGLYVRTNQPSRKLAWLVGAALHLVIIVFSGSRGAQLVLALATLWLGFPRLLHGEKRVNPYLRRAISVGIPLCLSGLLIAVAAASTDFSSKAGVLPKPSLWLVSIDLWQDHMWFGIGSGAFEPAITPYLDDPSVAYGHVESGILAAFVEWGFVLTAVVAAFIVPLIKDIVRLTARGKGDRVALIALLMACAHAAIEFSFHLMGIAAVATVLLCVVSGGQLRRTGQVRKVRRLALIIIAMSVSGYGLYVHNDGARTQVQDLSERLAKSVNGAGTVKQQALAAWKRHPADWAVAATAAQALALTKDKRTMRVANRAVARNPHNSSLHLFIARLLAANRRSAQASGEYRRAIVNSSSGKQIILEACRTLTIDAHLAAAIPVDPDHARARYKQLKACGRTEAAHLFAEAVLVAAPDNEQAKDIAGRAMYEQGRFLEAVEQLKDIQLWLPQKYVLRAYHRLGQPTKVFSAARQYAGAYAPGHRHRPLIYGEAARIAFLRNLYDIASEFARKQLKSADGMPKQQAKAHLQLADIAAAQGFSAQAAWHRARAKGADIVDSP